VTFFEGATIGAIVSVAPDPNALEMTFEILKFGTAGGAGGCAPNCLVGLGNLGPGLVVPNFGKKRGNTAVLSPDGTQQCVSQFGTPGITQKGSTLSLLLPVNTQCTPIPSVSPTGTSTALALPYWAIIVCAVGGFLLLTIIVAVLFVLIRRRRKTRELERAESQIKNVQAQLERSRNSEDGHMAESTVTVSL